MSINLNFLNLSAERNVTGMGSLFHNLMSHGAAKHVGVTMA